MTIQKSVNSILEQLEKSVAGLSNEQYTMKIDTLFGASIGEHVRHVIELFVCLQEGYDSGVVNYENRKRDTVIQTSKGVAIGLMKSINQSLFRDNKVILLQAGYNENSNELLSITTNYYREIAYNIEHAIHHMALIRIGINTVSDNEVPDGYGVAPSTLKYRKSIIAG